MKKGYYIWGLLALMLSFSCSSDKEVKIDENEIVGTWVATEFVIDDATASDDAKNGRDILDFLTSRDCYILSFTFNEDLTVTGENSSDYVEISVNSAGTGLDIPCPTQSDTDASTYTYNGSVLTVVDQEGDTVTVAVSINGDIMSLDAEDLDIPNFNDSGELLFKRI